MRDVGPPKGVVDRRQRDRRVADRRRGAERRQGVRRADGSRRAAGLGMRSSLRREPLPLPRVASREYGPLNQRTARAPKILRALLVAIVAIASLLAATLEEAKSATASSAAAKTGVVVKRADGVTATLSYVRKGGGSSIVRYSQLRLTVRASGRTTLRRLLLKGKGGTAYLTRPQVTVRELTGDGVPDVLVDVFTGGAHCCSISTIVRSTPKSWGSPLVHDWADHSYQLKDAGGSSTPEFITDDPRFTGAYAAYAVSASPIRIYSMEGGQLKVVTTQFPDWIRQDVTQWEQRWQDIAKEQDADIVAQGGRAAVAAWVADLALLQQFDAAKAVLAAAEARGDFKDFPGFGGQLGHDLKAWGYLADPAAIGLTDTPVS